MCVNPLFIFIVFAELWNYCQRTLRFKRITFFLKRELALFEWKVIKKTRLVSRIKELNKTKSNVSPTTPSFQTENFLQKELDLWIYFSVGLKISKKSEARSPKRVIKAHLKIKFSLATVNSDNLYISVEFLVPNKTIYFHTTDKNHPHM